MKVWKKHARLNLDHHLSVNCTVINSVYTLQYNTINYTNKLVEIFSHKKLSMLQNTNQNLLHALTYELPLYPIYKIGTG